MQLNLPQYDFKFKDVKNKKYIFDALRKKYVVLTPEEWVRQNFIRFLIENKNYPSSLIAIEAGLTLNTLKKRLDIMVYTKQAVPFLIVECKGPEVKISQKTFDQIVRYNMVHKAQYLMVTNGIVHYCCRINYETASYEYMNEVPVFE